MGELEHFDRLGGLKQGYAGLVVAAEVYDSVLHEVRVRFQSTELLQPWIEEHDTALLRSQVTSFDWGRGGFSLADEKFG